MQPEGDRRASKNAANFAAYVNAGYEAVKAVYPISLKSSVRG